ncbi:MAG: hypothetical protein FWG62_05145, partial [Proteobacteria bacterium]|nr:hypothetical protein [Pseudomonadota bacterium]
LRLEAAGRFVHHGRPPRPPVQPDRPPKRSDVPEPDDGFEYVGWSARSDLASGRPVNPDL